MTGQGLLKLMFTITIKNIIDFLGSPNGLIFLNTFKNSIIRSRIMTAIVKQYAPSYMTSPKVLFAR